MKIIIVIFFTLSSSDLKFKLNCVVLLLAAYIILSNKIRPFINRELALSDMLTHVVLIVVLFINFIIDNSQYNSSKQGR